MMDRASLVEEARSWLGTPYKHQCCKKGIACDCIGLIKGIYQDLYKVKIPFVPYSYDWGDANNNEDLLKHAAYWLEEIDLVDAREADVVGVRWKKQRVVKHAMILTSKNTAIHSYNRSGVTEINLSKWWKDKFVVAYRFPEVKD